MDRPGCLDKLLYSLDYGTIIMSINRGLHECFLPGQAWKEDPLAALQLIAHLRDIRNGKGENARALDAYVWLAKHHPRTLLANLREMVEVCIQACSSTEISPPHLGIWVEIEGP